MLKAAPADFTPADLSLRTLVVGFYGRHNPEKLPTVRVKGCERA